MNGTATRFLRLGVSLSGLVVLGWVLTGQAAKPVPHGISLPTDWSHSHVIFSQPATVEEAQMMGEDPRYWQQVHRREDAKFLRAEADDVTSLRGRMNGNNANGGLWSEDLGSVGGANSPGAGAGNYPAKYSFSTTTANCGTAATPDFVVFSTGILGSGSQASVVAYDNLYTGCGGTVPSVYWAYNTGGLILTSPIISLDGTQVAFAQTSGSPTGQAGVLLLKWKASTTEKVNSPGVPTLVSNALYRACVAPCMTEVFLHDGSGVAVDDRTSSPFYDYTNDVLWVGGANSWLHKLTGVFKTTPAEVSTGGFPVRVNAANPNALSDPVYDRISKNVFVGDAGGFFYRVASATGGSAVKTAQLDFGAGMAQSPVLDQTNGHLYIFSSSDGTSACTGGAACSAIYVLTPTFSAGATGTKVTVGTSVVSGNTPFPLYIGGFDSAYFSSVGGVGNLYVCGNTGLNPILYRVPISNGTFGTPLSVAGLTAGGQHFPCSPVTDYANPNGTFGNAERVFFSVQNKGFACANKGCLMNFTNLPWRAQTQYNVGQQILVASGATLYIYSAVVTGTSGSTQPTWSPSTSAKIIDGGVTWLNQGFTGVQALAGWTAGHGYGAQARIFDGTNVEVTPAAGTSGATTPIWNTTVGGTTPDGGVTWINAGPWPTAGLTVTSGAGGVIIDNSVSSTTLAGASQVYFFTLGNQLCSTSGGTGSCAMQASQSSLK